MNTPITQSKAWQELQNSLGEVSFREEGDGYIYLAILKEAKMVKYLYLPYGPVTKDRKGFENALKSLKGLAQRNDATFIRIEPQDPEIAQCLPNGTAKSQDLNPKETWVLDLKGTDEELKRKLPSRLLRYYRNMEKNSISIKTSNNPEDIKYLTKLQNTLAKEKGINTFSEKYLKTELAQPFSTLYYVKHKNQETGKEDIVAAGLVFDDKTTRYNLQGAQNDTGRKLHATGILTIQLILDAKDKGLETFDFWGIAPDGAPKDHPWAGFTNFKKTFAGYEVQYAGTYDVILDSTKYKLYQVLRKVNKWVRKI